MSSQDKCQSLPAAPDHTARSEPSSNAGECLPDNKANSWARISLALLLSFILLPPVAIVCLGGATAMVILGGATVWAVSVAAKYPLASLVSRLLGGGTSAIRKASAQGFLSAACELGAAAVYFLVKPLPNWANVIAFGLGAGCAEVIYVLCLGIVEGIKGRAPHAEAAWLTGARRSLCVRYSPALERFLALIGHTASRGLIYAGTSSPYYRTAVDTAGILFLAVLLFTAVDGVSYYGLKANWDWNSPRICRRFYSFVGGVTLIEAAVFLLFVV